MPLKLTISLNGNTFDADGDITFGDGLTALFRTWINAQSPTAADIDVLTDRLKAANDAQAAAVIANTPTSLKENT